MAANAGIPGTPPPYGDVTYVQAYHGPNGGYYGQHPPPYGNNTDFGLYKNYVLVTLK